MDSLHAVVSSLELKEPKQVRLTGAPVCETKILQTSCEPVNGLQLAFTHKTNNHLGFLQVLLYRVERKIARVL